MKPVLTKSIDNFFQYIGGRQSLRTIKTFNLNRNLYKYRLSNYLEYLEKAHLISLSSLPCPTTQGSLDHSNIRISKLIRSNLSLPEQPTCSACALKTSCKQQNKPGKGKATTADLTRFLYSWACQPPTEEKDEKSLLTLLDSLPIFIKNINNYPVALKQVQFKKVLNKFDKIKKFEKKTDEVVLRDKQKNGIGEDAELKGGGNIVEIDRVEGEGSENFQLGNKFEGEKDFGERKDSKEFKSSNYSKDNNDHKEYNGTSKKEYDYNESRGLRDQSLSRNPDELRNSKELKNSNDLNNYKENQKQKISKDSDDQKDQKSSSSTRFSKDSIELNDYKASKDIKSTSYSKETPDNKDKQMIRAISSPHNSSDFKKNSNLKDQINQVDSQDEEQDSRFEPIQVVKALKSRTPKRKPPLIPDKFKWNPDSVDILKQAKQERRQHRKSLESEVDLMVRRTTTKYKTRKSKHNRRRSINKPKL